MLLLLLVYNMLSLNTLNLQEKEVSWGVFSRRLFDLQTSLSCTQRLKETANFEFRP